MPLQLLHADAPLYTLMLPPLYYASLPPALRHAVDGLIDATLLSIIFTSLCRLRLMPRCRLRHYADYCRHAVCLRRCRCRYGAAADAATLQLLTRHDTLPLTR